MIKGPRVYQEDLVEIYPFEFAVVSNLKLALDITTNMRIALVHTNIPRITK